MFSNFSILSIAYRIENQPEKLDYETLVTSITFEQPFITHVNDKCSMDINYSKKCIKGHRYAHKS